MIVDRSIPKNQAPHDGFTTLLIVLALVIFAVLFLLPLYVMVVNSIKPLSEIQMKSILSLPTQWTSEPWRRAWSEANIGGSKDGLRGFFVNSALIAVPSVLLTTALGAFNGHILAQYRFRGSELIFWMMLLSCFIPLQAVLVPMAHFLGFAGLSDSLLGLTLVHTVYGLGYSSIFFRQFYTTLPQDWVRAAQLDGAGAIFIFRRIFLPLSAPIIVVSVVWQFTAVWNDFLLGSTFSGSANMPATVALSQFVSSSTSAKDFNVHLAASLLAALPTLIVYMLCSRLFLRGLVRSVIKG
jgi:glucose/mannose transport system permease protein